MSRSLTSRTTLVLVTAGVLLAQPLAAQAQPPEARAQATATGFALAASGFGTFVQGGQLPAGSDQTAFQHIGCTNKVGLSRENSEAVQDVAGLGTLRGVTTRVWTARHAGVVSSYSRHNVASLTLVDSPLGSLKVNAINSFSRAFHNASGFHTTTATSVGSITFAPAVGDPVNLPIPTPGQPLVVPGLATITLGDARTSHNNSSAKAAANALDIRVLPTDTRARVANTKAQNSSGVKSGIFSGWSASTKARGLADSLTSGKTPLQIMPCQGTGGDIRRRIVAALTLSPVIAVHGLTTTQRADSTTNKAWGYEKGSVAQVNLGDGQLVINAIVGKANVVRTATGVKRTATGTTVGAIFVDGERRTLPQSGVLEIPGVARLETNIVRKTANGISVVALRLTVLDGTGAVVDLGQAAMKVRGSAADASAPTTGTPLGTSPSCLLTRTGAR